MALDTSSGAYEQLFDNSAPENIDKYYEGYVEMKAKFKWSKYWCVLKKKNLYFFKDVNTQIKENYEGFFPLDGVTNIELKAKNNEWHMIKRSRKILLRTQNPQLRDTWIDSFKKSMKGEPPVANSYILPGSGPVSPVKCKSSLPGQCLPPSSPPPSSPPCSPSRKLSTESVRYHLQQNQIQNLNEHVQRIADNAETTTAEIKIQEQLIADQSWYQPSLRREDVTELLAKEKNGIFIVRDYIEISTSRNMGYVISLKDHVGEFRHHKIERRPDGNLLIKGYEGKLFDTLHNVLLFFIASQRKTVILVPYNPSQDDGGYEDMRAGFAQSNETPTTVVGKARSDSLKEHPVLPSYPTKARSKSLYHHRGLPPVPAPPTPDMDRAESFKHRALPRLPGDSQCSTSGYINVEGRVDSLQQRPLPTPHAADGTYISEGDYLNPVDQGLGSYSVRNKSIADGSQCDSYVDMLSPQKKLERIQSGLMMSPPMSPDQSYVNMAPQSFLPSYENIQPNPIEKRAPKLPPKRSASVRDDRPYVNLPAGGDRPPRPPLRKAHTLDR